MEQLLLRILKNLTFQKRPKSKGVSIYGQYELYWYQYGYRMDWPLFRFTLLLHVYRT